MEEKKSGNVATKLANDARDYWEVQPEEGFVFKTECSIKGPSPASSKLFINVGHCSQLPPPMEDWNEDELMQKLESDLTQIRVPISVGSLESTFDKQKKSARKVDVIMNSVFYRKRVDGSEFYRQLMFMIIIPDIELKHGLNINTKSHVVLRKTHVWDRLSVQYIRKTPSECLIKDDRLPKPINYEDIEQSPALKMQNFQARVIAGRFVEVTVQPTDTNGVMIEDVKRLRIKLNEDRIVVIVDNKRAVVDFYSPFRFMADDVDADFDSQRSSLTIRVPIDWL
ncbi:PIH1 domain-containing protein [Aphelenchoides besseyi]|nr:PIH1 domain-containing protein [Aphelenchoides besseyi]